MFKPHIGDCNSCPRKNVIIPVKSGECQYCNYEKKQKHKSNNHHGTRAGDLPESFGEYDAKNSDDYAGGNWKSRIPRSRNSKMQSRYRILLSKVLHSNSKEGSGIRANGNDTTTKYNRDGSIQEPSGMDKGFSRKHGQPPRKVGKKAKPPIRKTRKPIQHRKKGTGEAALFKEIFEERIQKKYPMCPTCDVCGTALGFEPKTFFFSHVLAKSTYPSLRLSRDNIWLCCLKCHQEWDQGDRSQPKFELKRQAAEKLKTKYYAGGT